MLTIQYIVFLFPFKKFRDSDLLKINTDIFEKKCGHYFQTWLDDIKLLCA